jgi:hypothetical protein
MKAHELLSSPETWCKESPGEDGKGNKVSALDPKATKWCALGAIQKVYHPLHWEEVMDRVLRALNVSEQGIAGLTKSDKACCLMEWNDDSEHSFRDIREVLHAADI